MNLNSIQTNHLSMVAYNWYISFLAAIENRNSQRVAANTSDQCVLSINTNDVLSTRERVVAELEVFWLGFENLEHELLNILGNDYSFCAEVLVHYQQGETNAEPLKTVTFFDRNELGQITSLRLIGNFSRRRSLISVSA